MNQLQNTSFDKLSKLYSKYFSLGYISTKNAGDKLAIISLTCCITNELRKQNNKITCYDVLKKICKDYSDFDKNTFLKSIAAICEDLMYGCDTFPNFDLKIQEMPKSLKKLLDNCCPF